MEFDGGALLVTAVIAVLAPLISEIPIGLRLPMVVVEVGLGILVGPHVLGWAAPTGMLALLGYFGLIFSSFWREWNSTSMLFAADPLSSRLKVGYFP
jgi:Kef-type K+ transport system membrane component KefB